MSLENIVPFGKYKDKDVQTLLRDRGYCVWFLTQEKLCERYSSLRERIVEAEIVFRACLRGEGEPPFDLIDPSSTPIFLTDQEKVMYAYYYSLSMKLKDEMEKSVYTGTPYLIKTPKNWLQTFEAQTGLKREDFKSFLASFDLDNITTIVEKVRAMGGMKYNGAKSYIIAKERSVAQEKWWEKKLRETYGNTVNAQYTLQSDACDTCTFDFVDHTRKIVWECKLGVKDFVASQYEKYVALLPDYKIIYLIGSGDEAGEYTVSKGEDTYRLDVVPKNVETPSQ